MLIEQITEFHCNWEGLGHPVALVLLKLVIFMAKPKSLKKYLQVNYFIINC